MTDAPKQDLGFVFKETKAGDIIIYHHGKQATILRGARAEKTRKGLEASSFQQQQQLLARVTGNYKRGNEKKAKKHRKNAG